MLKAEDIRGYNLFTGLEETELAEIAKLCTKKSYAAGTILFDPLKTTEDVFLLEGGNEAIQIEIPLGDGQSKIIVHTLSKGETFGWAPLCPVRIRTSTARVIEPASVLQIKGADLRRLCDENCHMGYLIMKNLSGIISLRLDSTIVVLRHKLQKTEK
ncbi:MAG: cyclic nucleotide-binding domain-containing protein [Dehalococcoidales bacterium]|nr:cyclic nucleotide-binding domain-containing protein [Dehalococcoidales bacterium]